MMSFAVIQACINASAKNMFERLLANAEKNNGTDKYRECSHRAMADSQWFLAVLAG